MDRQPGSGRPATVTTEENEELVGDLICSQEENPGTHLSPREIEKVTGISRTSVRRMVKRRGLKQFKKSKNTKDEFCCTKFKILFCSKFLERKIRFEIHQTY